MMKSQKLLIAMPLLEFFRNRKRWPQNIEILCATAQANELLLQNGLTIRDKQTELYQQGATKIIMEDTPLHMKNGVMC